MKRLHVHVSVNDLARSVRFYATLFAAPPSVVQADYAKWMLEDPRMNFAISTRSARTGLDHLGIQVEDEAELHEVYARLQQADAPVLEQGATTCCYAQSEKSWIVDPQGVSWETFLTRGAATTYGDSADLGPIRTAAAPQAAESACCATPAEAPSILPPAAAACCARPA